MQDSAGEGTRTRAGEIDPDIRRFVTRVNADYSRLTGGRELPVTEMRRVAEGKCSQV